MNKRIKLLMVILVSLALFAAGCGASKTAAPTPAPAQSTSSMPNEDPAAFIKEMNQTIAAISEQSKLNKLEDAKKSAADLVALQERLTVHITDAKQKEALHHNVLNLQAEVQKPSPSQSAIDGQLQILKTQLVDLNKQMTGHKHQ